MLKGIATTTQFVLLVQTIIDPHGLVKGGDIFLHPEVHLQPQKEPDCINNKKEE